MSNIITSDWIKYFPYKKVRPEQETAINFVLNAFDNNKKYVIGEFPIGIGKSAIALTISKYYNNKNSTNSSYIVTTQKILQEQYMRDFPTMASITAKQNYQCVHRTTGITCDMGLTMARILGAVKNPYKMYAPTCVYKIDKDKFDNSNISLTNLPFFLNHVDSDIKPRNLLVIDECFSGDSMIWIEGGMQETIRDIVEGNNLNYVMSFNEDKNIYEKKKILRKIKIKCHGNEDWYTIHVKTEDGIIKKLKKVTGNHKVWTKNRGYIRVDELNADDVLKIDANKKKSNIKKYKMSCIKCRKEFDVIQAFNLHYNMKHNKEFYTKNRAIITSDACNKKRNINISIAVKGRNKETHAYIEKCSKRMKKNNPMMLDDVKKKMVESCKKFYINNPDKLLERKSNFINAPLYNKNKRNGYENRILELCNKYKELDSIKYTGNGKFWVSFGKKHKNPDFKIKNQRKVIEVGHSYWHNDIDVKKTIDDYKKINFDCLYIKEDEIFKDDIYVFNLLYKFINNHDAKIIKIKKLQKKHRSFKNEEYKYNLEIEDNHNYFANSILVSNCHNIENSITDFASMTFTKYFVQETLKMTWPNVKYMNLDTFIDWIKTKYATRLLDEFLTLKGKLNGMQSQSYLESKSGMGAVRKIDEYKRKLEQVSEGLKIFKKDEWVITVNGTEDIVNLKPIFADKYTNKMLFKMGDKVLLMSGTILDKDTFCKNVGINTNDAAFLSLDSPFPVKNRPVYEMMIGSMSRYNIDKTLPVMVLAIKEILKEHKNDKGIIHCHNYKIAKYISDNINDDRLLFHSSDDRIDTLNFHMMSKEPTVLVSPSFTEGIDLVGELSRFQIIAKIPFPFLGDNYVKTKMDRVSGWYEWQTLKTIIQGSGRSIRDYDDYAITYILDSDWIYVKKKNWNMIPKWFKEALQK